MKRRKSEVTLLGAAFACEAHTIQNGSDSSCSHKTALELAIQRGHGKVVEVLLVACSIQSEENHSPSDLAFVISFDEIVRYARVRVPAFLEVFVRQPLMALLPRDVAEIVCFKKLFSRSK